MTTWVVDSGPLIFLAKLNRLELLKKSANVLVIPPTVLQEIQGHHDQACKAIIQASYSWLKVLSPKSNLILTALDPGEAEVIALAYEIQADYVVLDDLQARRVARQLNLDSVGTLGLLLAARLRGEIPSLKTEITRLQNVGFWANKKVIEAVLKTAGEIP